MKNTEITREELEAVKYGDLKAKFEELKIEDVWQNGIKKGDLIENALTKLAEIKKKAIEAGDIVEEQLTNVEVVDEKTAEAVKETEVADPVVVTEDPKKVKDNEQTPEVAELPKAVITKEDLKKNLVIIDANLRNGIPGHRDKLLKMQAELQAALDKFEEE